MNGWQKAVITQVQPASDDMLSLTIKPEHWQPHKAGQCYEVRIPGARLMRKYSVVSSPHHQDELEFGIQLLPYGAVSPKMWELKTGDTLDIRGPFGTFTWEPSARGPLILIGGGSGVTPLISIYNNARKLRPKGEIIFIISAKHAGRVMHYEKLKEHIVTRFTATEGRIDKAFLTKHIGEFADNPKARCYVCGPEGFASDTVDVLLEMGFADPTIMFEGFS
jgi:ferredoxin-NADP reductase